MRESWSLRHFSGSHQDAINKGLTYHRERKLTAWRVPYLPIDPADIGRTYKAIIRINNQSGKGGLAYIMEQNFGYILPKPLQPEFSQIVQAHSERTMAEVSPQEIKTIFETSYIAQPNPYIEYRKVLPQYLDEKRVRCELSVKIRDRATDSTFNGEGNGPVDAAKTALEQLVGRFELLDYYEHALGRGSDAQAIAYLEVRYNNHTHFGAGIDTNITAASLKALISALNFSFQHRNTNYNKINIAQINCKYLMKPGEQNYGS